MPHQHLDCNIPHNRQAQDALWSTKQIEIKYVAQEHNHTGESGDWTHNIDGLVIMSPALLQYITHALHCAVKCLQSTSKVTA